MSTSLTGMPLHPFPIPHQAAIGCQWRPILLHLCRPVKQGPGCILHRDVQEEQNEKMPESNLRVHGTSCAAPITADSESGKQPERGHTDGVGGCSLKQCPCGAPSGGRTLPHLQLRSYPPTITGSQPGLLVCPPHQTRAAIRSVRSAVFHLVPSVGDLLGTPGQFPRVQLCYPHSGRLIRPTSTSYTNSYSEFPNSSHTPARLQGINITGSGPPNTTDPFPLFTHTMRQSSVHSNLMGRK